MRGRAFTLDAVGGVVPIAGTVRRSTAPFSRAWPQPRVVRYGPHLRRCSRRLMPISAVDCDPAVPSKRASVLPCRLQATAARYNQSAFAAISCREDDCMPVDLVDDF